MFMDGKWKVEMGQVHDSFFFVEFITYYDNGAMSQGYDGNSMEDYWNIMEYGWSMIGDTLWQSKVAEWHIRELNGGLNGNFMELNGRFPAKFMDK